MGIPLQPAKNMRTELLLSDRWVDITDDVRQPSGAPTNQGAASQDRVTPPASLSLVLENESNRYSRRNPLSPNYGQLRNNMPIRNSNLITRDRFGRTVANGWGIGDHADLWTAFQSSGTAADFAVASGVASHVVVTGNTSRLSYMPQQQHRAGRVSIEFMLSVANVTGADIEPANLVMRGQTTGNYLMLRVVLNTAETYTLQVRNADGTLFGSGAVAVPGLTHTAGTWMKAAFQTEGNTARAKLWAVDTDVPGSDGEPLDWHLEVAASNPVRGWVGVRSGAASGNTNVPVTINYRNFEVVSDRFIGEVAALSPEWNEAESDRTARLEAAGLMRRLGQGSPVLKSTLRRGILTLPTLLQYWPMEDGAEAASLASAIVGAPAMTVEGDFTLSSYDGFASSEPIPALGPSILRGNVPSYAATGELQTRWIMRIPDAGLTDNTLIHRVWLAGGSIAFFDVSSGGAGQIRITANTGAAEVLNINIGFDIREQDGRASLQLVQDGADIDWSISWYAAEDAIAGGFGATLAGHTFGIATQVCFSLNGDLEGTAIGHATVESSVSDIYALSAQLNAYNGETAMARFGRLCFEEGVPATIIGEYDPAARMGPQLPDTLPALLKQCAETDQGILGESRGALGLKYRTRLSMINQSVALTIDRSAGELSKPFKPTDDDRITLNDVTAKRIGGSSYRVEQTTGPFSVSDPPEGAGRVDADPEFSAYTDGQLPHLATWAVSLGTVDEYRIPSVAVDLCSPDVSKNAGLIADVLSLDVGDLVVVTGLSELGIYDDVRQIARGYSENQIYPSMFKLTMNTFPASPYDALVLDSEELGRLDPNTSTVDADFSATAPSFSVATTDENELWTTDAADFPQDVMVGGERVTISGISGATSPQTFTVSVRSVNGVTKSHVAGASVNVFRPVRLA